MANLVAGTKFAALALHHCSNVRLETPIEVLPDVTVYPSAPMPMDATWTKWLGTFRAEYLSNATLVIVATKTSDERPIPRDLGDHLDKRATCFFYALCMSGVPDHSGAIMVGGAVDETGPDVWNARDVTTMWRFIHAPRVLITADTLRAAAPIADGAWALHHTPDRFDRLLRGFRAWVKGLQEHLQPDRLHQFVRSVEAFMRSPNGAVFATQCAALCPGGDPTVFREIYNLRNAIEHLNDWTEVLGDIPPEHRTRHATIRAFQIEQFASFLYRQVCVDPARLAAFADDASISRFIRSDAEHKQQIIGGVFDLDAVEAQLRFMP